MLVDKSSDDARIERVRMKNDADASGGGQAKRPRKTERVKKRKNAHDAIVGLQHENLVELLHVRSNIVVSKDDTLGVTRRAAGKNNRSDVVQRRMAIASANLSTAFAGKRHAANAAAARSPKPAALATSSM